MKIWLNRRLKRAHLSIQHACSSYGIPVLIVDGEPLGPGDVAINEVYLAEATAKERSALAAAGYTMPSEPWGFRLRRLRLQAKLSQQELASRTGLSQSQIAQLESRLHEPSGRTLRRLRAALPKI